MLCTSLRRARAAATATLIATGVLAAAPSASAEPPADPPGRSAEAPGQQEAPPGLAAAPAEPAPPAPPADVPPGPPGHAGASPAGEPAGPPPEVPPGPPAHAAAQGPPEEVPPAPPGGGTGNGEEAPGNTGTVKIHDVGTPDDDRREEPKVCVFRIVGFGFPADADLVVSIAGQGGPNVAGTGSFGPTEVSVDSGGDFAIAGPTLPDGLYKLSVENTTAPGGAKQKVFEVDCPAEVGGTEEEPPGGEETTDGEVLGVTRERTVTESADAAAAVATRPTEVLGVQQTRGALAFSGAAVGGLVLLGGGLLAGGTALRRRAAQ